MFARIIILCLHEYILYLQGDLGDTDPFQWVSWPLYAFVSQIFLQDVPPERALECRASQMATALRWSTVLFSNIRECRLQLWNEIKSELLVSQRWLEAGQSSMNTAIVIISPVSTINLISFVNNDFVYLEPVFSLHYTSCNWSEHDLRN